jgi:hypothetical protein
LSYDLLPHTARTNQYNPRRFGVHLAPAICAGDVPYTSGCNGGREPASAHRGAPADTGIAFEAVLV